MAKPNYSKGGGWENENTQGQVSSTDEPATHKTLHIRLAFASAVANACVLIVMGYHDY